MYYGIIAIHNTKGTTRYTVSNHYAQHHQPSMSANFAHSMRTMTPYSRHAWWFDLSQCWPQMAGLNITSIAFLRSARLAVGSNTWYAGLDLALRMMSGCWESNCWTARCWIYGKKAFLHRVGGCKPSTIAILYSFSDGCIHPLIHWHHHSSIVIYIEDPFT